MYQFPHRLEFFRIIAPDLCGLVNGTDGYGDSVSFGNGKRVDYFPGCGGDGRIERDGVVLGGLLCVMSTCKSSV